MINGFYLPKEFISFRKGCTDWKQAIRASCNILLEKGYITQKYIDNIILNVENYGPYIVIAQNIALPHARPEFGSEKVGYSVMICKDAVIFEDKEEKKSKLFIAISSVNAINHLNILRDLSRILSDKQKVHVILESGNVEKIQSIFNNS